MTTGSIALWMVIPLGWVELAGAIAQVRTVGYVIALVGCPLTMVAWGRVLLQLGLAYERLSDPDADRPVLLETIVVVSFVLALIAFLAWFFIFAGSPSATPWPDEMSGPGQ